MSDLQALFDNNRRWADNQLERDPNYFKKLSSIQRPRYLWIGCSDSRVPANEIVGLLPGEIFVHRNIANLVVHTDLNALSVLQYAVEALKIEHIIVCGHYGCGGVHAAYENKQLGLIDNWLRNIKDIYHKYRGELEGISKENERLNRLCELNVIEQVSNVCHTAIVQNAWANGQKLSVHGVIYDLRNGILKDMAVRISGPQQLDEIYKMMPAPARKIGVVSSK